MTSAPKEVARVCAIPGLTRKQLPIDREGTVASAQLNGLRICGCNWLSCLTDSLPQIQGMPIIFSSLSGETGPKPCQGKEGQQGQTLPLTGQRRADEGNVEIKVCPKLREAEGYADYILESV